jgi:hypothetical protein
MAQIQAERGNQGGPSLAQQWYDPTGLLPPANPDDELDRKPTVWRVGKLPPDIPPWFRQYDTDNDGQVGLYEWKAQNQSLDLFLQIDRNGDGFLTIDEVMAWVNKQRGTTALANGNGTGTPVAANGFGGQAFGGPGFGGMGRGMGRGMGGGMGRGMGGASPWGN